MTCALHPNEVRFEHFQRVFTLLTHPNEYFLKISDKPLPRFAGMNCSVLSKIETKVRKGVFLKFLQSTF